ncbi:MAG: primosomal protein N' [Thermodesulfobacteriota bacterium]
MSRESELTGDAARSAQGAVEVAIVDPSGALTTLSYAVPSHLSSASAAGSAVTVPLGARRVTGFVLGPARPAPTLRLRPISAALPELSVPAELLELALWAARYYRVPPGALLRAVVPPPLRRLRRRHVRPTGEPLAAIAEPALIADAGGRGAASGEGLAQRILDRLPPGGLDLRQLEEEFGAGTGAALRTLRRRGAVTIDDVELERRTPRRAVRATPPEGGGEPSFGRALRQAEVYSFVRARAPHPVPVVELEERMPGSARAVAALVRRGLLVETSSMLAPAADGSPAPLAAARDQDVPLPATQRTPSAEQDEAIAAIASQAGFATFLLFGVTGSGKTEVYLRAAHEVRRRGMAVLILVPEIGLTPQLVAEAARRFPGETAVLHSALSGPERWQAWRDVAAGRTPIVIGARSAVFAPLPRLGLVVVDEEHDAAYKQEEAPRYNARDLAVMRGKLAGCPVVLASATPSLESYRAAQQGRYRLLRLSARAGGAPLPSVELIDLRSQPAPAGGGDAGRAGAASDRGTAPPPVASPLSPALEQALLDNYRAGDQSLLFLNRRGYARFIQCEACGHVETCPSCSVSLTVHRAQRLAACHHCGFSRRPATHCPSCESVLTARGFGTEQIEANVRALLPAARIARLDRDTAASAGFVRRTVDAWRHGELDVLVGTQMVAKGHDAPGVTLIGVILADASLHFPDFRAAERTFQLLAQVAGRAGRGVKPGRVLVQTRQPDHPSLVAAARHDYEAFARDELRSRRELRYPPFGRLARILVEGDAAEVERRARAIAARLQSAAESLEPAQRPQVLGPAPAPLERLRGRWRSQLLVKAADHRALGRVLDALRAPQRTARDAAAPRVVVDVDPMGML